MAEEEALSPEHSMLGGRQWGSFLGHQWEGPTSSAWGTEHPADKALGNLRRINTFKHAARGTAGGFDAQGLASAIMNSANSVVGSGDD
jgi:hypothetical protein